MTAYRWDHKSAINISYIGYDFYDVMVGCKNKLWIKFAAQDRHDFVCMFGKPHWWCCNLSLKEPIVLGKNRVNKRRNTDVLCGICTIMEYARVCFTMYFSPNLFIQPFQHFNVYYNSDKIKHIDNWICTPIDGKNEIYAFVIIFSIVLFIELLWQ